VNNTEELKLALDRISLKIARPGDFPLLASAAESGELKLDRKTISGDSNIVVEGNAPNAVIFTLNNGSTFVYEGDSAAVLESLFEKYLNPGPPLRTPDLTPKRSELINYTQQGKFVGRGYELEKLREFVSSSCQFSWWLCTGSGGVGKSRLALEFGLSLDQRYKFGFLVDDRDFQWRMWQPTAATVIIVDYVAGRAKHVGHVIETLELRKGSLRYPVRIILLERVVDDTWFSVLFGTGSRLDAVRAAQYMQEPLKIVRLSSEELWQIFAEDLLERGKSVPAKDLVLSTLNRIDPEGRPLFAVMLARAVAEQTKVLSLQLDAQALLSLHLKRERENIWMPASASDRDQHLVAYATIVGGIDLKRMYEISLAGSYFPKLGLYRPERIEAMTGHDATERVAPLEPDLFGEYFVLEHIRPTWVLDTKRAENFAAAAWDYDPVPTCLFVCKALHDFRKHPSLTFFLSAPRRSQKIKSQDDEEWAVFVRDVVLATAIAEDTDAGDLAHAEEMYSALAACQASRQLKAFELQIRVEAAGNLSALYSRSSRRTEAEMLYREVCELGKLIPGDHPLIDVPRTFAGVELIELYCREDDLVSAQRVYSQIEPNTKVPRIVSSVYESATEAVAALVGLYKKGGDLEGAVKAALTLKDVPDLNRTRAFMRGWSLISLEFIVPFLEVDSFEAALAFYYEIRRATIKYPAAEEICFLRACGALSCTIWVTQSNPTTIPNIGTFFAELAELCQTAEAACQQPIAPIQKQVWRRAKGFFLISLIRQKIVLKIKDDVYDNWDSLRELMEDPVGFEERLFSEGLTASMKVVEFFCELEDLARANSIYLMTLRKFSWIQANENPLSLLSATMRLTSAFSRCGDGPAAEKVVVTFLDHIQSNQSLELMAKKSSRTPAQVLESMRLMITSQYI
jgi:hypothetical protein